MAYEYVENSEGKMVRVNEPEPTKPTVSTQVGGESVQYGTPEYDAAKTAQNESSQERLAARDADLLDRGYTQLTNSPSGVTNVFADPYGWTPNSPFTQDQHRRMVEESGKDNWTMHSKVQEEMQKAGNWDTGENRYEGPDPINTTGRTGGRTGSGDTLSGTGGPETVVGGDGNIDFTSRPIPTGTDMPQPDGSTGVPNTGGTGGGAGGGGAGGGGAGGSDPNNPVPDMQDGVPTYDPENFSGDVGTNSENRDITGQMDYNIPEVGDAPFVTDSGTAGTDMTPWDVTEEQTVAGQLEQLYDRDSPFFEQARQRAIRQSLSSGGQNSAMAGAFGELAAMDTAFKVGQADAATYARSAEFNAAMSNQYSLAEQRFVHNALLSDQSFHQAGALQTQRLEGQMEAIMLDYQGRSALMDQEMDNWFLQAKQTYEYTLGTMYEQAGLAEGQAGRDFSRTMMLNGMNSMTNFYTNATASLLEAANNPNLTPEQSRAAMENGSAWLGSQWDMLQAYWGQYAAGGPPLQDFTGSSNSNWSDFNSPFSGDSNNIDYSGGAPDTGDAGAGSGGGGGGSNDPVGGGSNPNSDTDNKPTSSSTTGGSSSSSGSSNQGDDSMFGPFGYFPQRF